LFLKPIRASRCSRFWKVIGVQTAVFLALLLVAEGAVRVLRPEILPQNLDVNLFDPFAYAGTYGYKAHAQGNEFGAVYVTDDHGFRIDPNIRPVETQRKIVVLGDSVSVGIGVTADEAYPFVLQRRLSGQRVFNASVTGYGMTDYAQVLDKVAGTVTPDTVVIGWCLNDLAARSQAQIVAMIQKRTAPSTAGPDPSRYPNPLVRWLRSLTDRYPRFHDVLKTYSRTYLLLKSLATDSSRDYFTADKLMYSHPSSLDLLTSEFSHLKTLAVAHRISLLLIVFPYEYQLRAPNEAGREPQRIIQQAGTQAGVQTYDLFDDLVASLASENITSRSLYLFNDPMHFNARGHRLIAELVHKKVTSRN
jgi:lysophospholipase L1-like esterase